MKKELLSIKQRQSEREVSSIIRDLEGEIKGLSDSNRETVGSVVIKRLKAIKAGREIGTRASLLVKAILYGTWPIAVPEAKEALKSDAVVRKKGAEC